MREGRGPRLIPPPSSRPLLPALRLSLQMCFRRVPPQTLPPASESQAALSQHPHALGCVSCVQGRAGWGVLPWVPAATGRTQTQRPFSEPVPHLPPKTQTQPSSRPRGFSLLEGVLLFGRFFGYFPLSGGWGGGAPHAGLGTCPVPKACRAPTPSCSICVQRAKCPPLSRNKTAPPAREMAGGAERGRDRPPLQSENPN